MTVRLEKLIGRALKPKRHRGFARDDSGVTAVEFGLLAVPFFSIIGAILETSIVFLSGQVLDSAVHDVSRLIRTGQVQATNMTGAQFKQRICDRLYGLFSDCDALHIEVRDIDRFNSASASPPIDPESGTTEWTRPEVFLPGQGSSIVLVQVYYRWPVLLNLLNFSLSDLPDGTRLMGSVTVFSNEPFTL